MSSENHTQGQSLSYESAIVVGKCPTASLLNIFICIFRPVCIGVSYANIRGAAFVFVKDNTNLFVNFFTNFPSQMHSYSTPNTMHLLS